MLFSPKPILVSFHGPTLNSDLIKKELVDFTIRSFLRTLTQPSAPGGICQGYEKSRVGILRRGIASGPLFGGNLSLLCATLATVPAAIQGWNPLF